MFPIIDILGIRIGTYGLCILLAAALMVLVSVYNSRKRNIDSSVIIVIFAITFGFCLLGAKMLYIVVTYSPELLVKMISRGDFSFASQNGGLVFYGGLVGGIIGALIGAKMMKIKLSDIEDGIVPYIPLAHAIGRVGCFLGGCCYGIPYNGICAIPYGKLIAAYMPDETIFPVQLLEAFLDVIIFMILLIVAKKKREAYDLLFIYLALYGVMRFLTEFLRGDTVRGISMGVSTSQWISIGIAAVCVIRYIIKRMYSKKVN